MTIDVDALYTAAAVLGGWCALSVVVTAGWAIARRRGLINIEPR